MATMPEDLNLSNLKPAQSRRARKRIGRGLGSGKGRYAGRGVKGQKARSGSHKMRPGFEGGQNPIYMRLGKQRGPYSKDAMPVGPHRTSTVPVNVAALEERFDTGAEVTPEALVEKGVLKNTKIEAAGGSVTLLREPKERKPKRRAQKPVAAEPEEPQAEAEPEPEPKEEEG